MGIDRFFSECRLCGVDGIIIPDLIPEEAEELNKASRKYGIHLIYLVAPTTPNARIKWIAQKTRGFLYAVSLTGVTGARKALPTDLAKFLKSVKAVCLKPVAVGFGLLYAPAGSASVLAQADGGVIVGSALIRSIEKSERTSFQGAVHFVKSLRQTLDRKAGKEPAHAS